MTTMTAHKYTIDDREYIHLVYRQPDGRLFQVTKFWFKTDDFKTDVVFKHVIERITRQ